LIGDTRSNRLYPLDPFVDFDALFAHAGQLGRVEFVPRSSSAGAFELTGRGTGCRLAIVAFDAGGDALVEHGPVIAH
jgi:hypothetical protein